MFPCGRRGEEAAEGEWQATLSLLVVYDLPNRDCAANSSAGELKVEENGVARYRTEFIDVIAAHFKNYPNSPSWSSWNQTLSAIWSPT